MINTISKKKSFNNFLYFLILVLSINILEIDTVMKGIFFITISLVIIYLDKVIIFKYSSLLIIDHFFLAVNPAQAPPSI